MSAARTERLLNLLTLLLNTRRPIALREIRELDEFQAYCSDDPKSGERAFERDKAALIELGVPLRWVPPESDEDEDGIGGYLIDRESYYLPELTLTPSELALLSMAGAAALAIDAFPGRSAMVRAMAKLGFDADASGSMPSMVHTPTLPGESGVRMAQCLDTLHEAVATKRAVKISYQAAQSEITERVVDPYGLYYRRGVWYLVGYCHLRKEQRTFHLGRMTAASMIHTKSGDAPMEIPPEFNLKAHAERRPWEYPGGEPQHVVIRLAQRLVPAIPEIFGAHVIIEPRADGETWVHIQATQPMALMSAVLPHGAAAEVMAPEGLRNALRATYSDLLERYQTTDVPEERKIA